MDAAGRVQRTALGTLAEIDPPALSDVLQDLLEEASLVPGVVTVQTAERLGGTPAGSAVLDRAVGVQLSYEGLRLTRELIRDESRYAASDPTESYLALVAAEVLVSRGFVELADTAVAGRAIDIVQRFSRNQTVEYREDPGPEEPGHSLEYDVVALAVAAGATAVLDRVPPYLDEFGERLAADLDREPLPPVTDVDTRIRTGLEAAVVADDAAVVND